MRTLLDLACMFVFLWIVWNVCRLFVIGLAIIVFWAS